VLFRSTMATVTIPSMQAHSKYNNPDMKLDNTVINI
jgi:hypothetical protein